MSPVKLNAIEGLVPEKYTPNTTGLWRERYDGWNSAIDLQGYKKIGLNRERLAKLLFKITYCQGHSWNTYKAKSKHSFEYMMLEKADAIIRDESTLIEVKPDAI